MKKSLTFTVFLLLILNIFIIPLSAQDAIPPGVPQLPGLSGEMNDEIGLPSEFAKFKEIGDELSEEESRKAYLKQEWTKILAKNKFFGPVLFYTNKFFGFFNPLWKILFGIEFSWSWAFFIALILWVSLIIFFYYPGRAFTDNPLFGIIIGIAIASIMGVTGVIRKTTDILSLILKNIWFIILAIIIVVAIDWVYIKSMKNLKKESEEEELKKSKEYIKAEGRVAKKSLESHKNK